MPDQAFGVLCDEETNPPKLLGVLVQVSEEAAFRLSPETLQTIYKVLLTRTDFKLRHDA